MEVQDQFKKDLSEAHREFSKNPTESRRGVISSYLEKKGWSEVFFGVYYNPKFPGFNVNWETGNMPELDIYQNGKLVESRPF